MPMRPAGKHEAAQRRGGRGQGLVEYALALVFVAMAVLGAVTLFGGAVANLYTSVVGRWPSY